MDYRDDQNTMIEPEQEQPELAPETMREPRESRRQRSQEQSEEGENIVRARRVLELIEQKLSSSRKVPMTRDLYMVNVGEVIDLIGQMHIVLPKTVLDAQSILRQKDEIIAAANEYEKTVQSRADAEYRAKVQAAQDEEARIHQEAETYDRMTRERVSADAQATIANANAQAAQIIENAGQRAQQLTMDSEITRRAQALALEIEDTARQNADAIYTKACDQVNQMLSVVAGALSARGKEMADLREQLLGRTASIQDGQDYRGEGY